MELEGNGALIEDVLLAQQEVVAEKLADETVG